MESQLIDVVMLGGKKRMERTKVTRVPLFLLHCLKIARADSVVKSQKNHDTITQICRWHHPCGRKRRTKSLLMRVKESEKAGLKLNIQKTKIMVSSPITSWQIDGSKHDFLSSVIIKMLLCLTASRHWINSGVSHSPAPSHVLRFSSAQFSRSVVSNYLQPHGLQHVRPPCPSPTPGACSNSCPLTQWCHATISSSVVPFSYCLQSFPASGSFSSDSVLPIRWPKYWSFSLSPSNEYSRLISFRIDWFDQLSVQGTLNSLLPHIWISTDKLGETLTYFKPSFSLKTLSQNQSQSFVFNGLYCQLHFQTHVRSYITLHASNYPLWECWFAGAVLGLEKRKNSGWATYVIFTLHKHLWKATAKWEN